MDIIFTVNIALVIQIVLAVLLPIAVAFVTTRITSSAKKSWLLAGLTLVTSIVTGLSVAVAQHTAFDLGMALFLALPQFIISVAMYYGLWKPTGIAQAAQDVNITTLVK